MTFSAEIPMSFKLSSLLHTAYRAPVGQGFGFIQPSSGGKDVFVHISAVEKAGLSSLNEGQTVEYEEVANRGKTSAENLKV